MIRSRWSIVYLMFYFLLGSILLFLNQDLSSAVITIMNIIIVLTPLIGTIFGVMYFYSSREFTDLLLSQPIKRSHIILGQYLGISSSLSISLVIGLGLPFIVYGLFSSIEIFNFLILIITGVVLTFVFVSLSTIICLSNSNKIKGFGYSILMWLFFAVIYDGLLLIILIYFDEYPIDKLSLILSSLNPIDLSRILILLKLDISALMGYTGAVFQNFFGTGLGLSISSIILMLWMAIPTIKMIRMANRKDF